MYAFKASILAAAALLGTGLYTATAYAETVESTDTCTREEERANKAAVINSYGAGIESFLKALTPDYEQHNPEFRRMEEINGVKGAAVFPMMNEAFALTGQGGMPKSAPGQPPSNNKYLVLAQCDLVTVMTQGFEPDPQYPGKFYPIYRFDIYRVKGATLTEHWDGGKIPDPVPEYLKKSVKELRAEKAKEAPGGAK